MTGSCTARIRKFSCALLTFAVPLLTTRPDAAPTIRTTPALLQCQVPIPAATTAPLIRSFLAAKNPEISSPAPLPRGPAQRALPRPCRPTLVAHRPCLHSNPSPSAHPHLRRPWAPITATGSGPLDAAQQVRATCIRGRLRASTHRPTTGPTLAQRVPTFMERARTDRSPSAGQGYTRDPRASSW